jgi:hypothetical protein
MRSAKYKIKSETASVELAREAVCKFYKIKSCARFKEFLFAKNQKALTEKRLIFDFGFFGKRR